MLDDLRAERTDAFGQRCGADLNHTQLAPIRRTLEGLVDVFEVRRSERIAAVGATVVAAYDAGIKHAVHEAIDELNAGRYGYCVTCSERISFDRLCAVPYARRCAGCQHQEELRWNEVEHLFAGYIRHWVGEPQGPTVRIATSEISSVAINDSSTIPV